MKVLGIDPGYSRAGWGMVEKIKGNVHLIEYGCIVTTEKEKHEKRLLTLYQEIKEVLSNYQPDVAAIEDLFYTTNAKTVITVAHARGVIFLAIAEKNIPVVSYSPRTVKLAIGGYGKAEKRQMQKMVQATLKLPIIPQPDDAADAIAIALTHCFSTRW